MALSNPKNANFGEVALGTNAPKSIGRSVAFVITEMKRVGTGQSGLVPTGVIFTFAKENFSAPRGPQEFGVELRTSRQDLPGAEEPVEQVLGWNYTPFTVSGIWDNRYGGQGYAENMRRDFEELTKRGNIVLYQFEQVSIYGLVKNFKVNYQRQDRQAYSFTISPHFRREGETVRVNPNPVSITDPKTSVLKSRAALELLKADQVLASLRSGSRIQSLLKGSVFSEMNDTLDTIETHITSAENTVNNEILNPAQNAANALNRAAQTMNSVKTAVSTLLNQTRLINATANMSIASLVQNLQFENWHRSVSASSRGLVVTTDKSRQDFALRATPKPKRLHRVHQGESLYQISTLYYGTPHHWRDILVSNKLNSIVLYGGELLIIPEIKL